MSLLDIFSSGDTRSLTMDEPHPSSLLDSGAQGVIGKPLPRVEGPLKVAGKATYAAEYPAENLAYGVLVRSTVSAGRIAAIHADEVQALPGVIAVVTDYDTFLRNAAQGGDTDAPVQGVEEIQYHGEIIAVVVAETFEIARDAAARLRVDYEPGEGRYDFERYRNEAERPPDSQVEAHSQQGDPDGAFAAAAVKVSAVYTTPSQNSAAMEPHASIAEWKEDGTLLLHGAYQMVASDQQQLADALGLKADQVRIISRYVGGGFGSKLGIAPESVAAAIAAKQLGRPVKIVMARQQVFDATVRRSNTEQHLKLGADADGRIVALIHDSLVSNLPDEDFFEPVGIGTHFAYAGENRRINHDVVRLNRTLSGSMRAPGEAVGQMALEAALDELAEATGVDPIELRRRNEPPQDPEKQIPFSSRALVPCMEKGAALFGWADRKAPGSDRRGEWLHGIGMAAAVRSNMLQKSAAQVTLTTDGRAIVETDMTDIGTGTYTILAQIAGETLGLPLDRVIVHLGDGKAPPAAGSGGSWGAASSGSSVYLACELVRERLAKKMGVDPAAMTLKDGRAIAENRAVDLTDLVDENIVVTGQIAPGKQEKLHTQASYGAHFCAVKVNAVTGEVRVERMLGVFAAGRVLNEQTARSQCLGGMTFGIGAALTEELVHDPRNGKIVNRDMAEYHLPVNADVPQLEVHFLPERDINANPIHAKGIGELGISGAGAAVANAIYNATGVRVRDYPITCDKLLAGLPD
ncbi:xanthine dehydrogenase family protein molybdopterin-binding subunit [Sphingomonas corticis]|jgi:xanthine dehydrogenase YagR molybdenum-binding subunit|uniref:Xanthine dehydrogenase family protein molybdopterin-binding subunit n=1 Tax=Sphingomonas corticis TaxID=2722791 RepID=A0ABX1CRJ2_9SPHN|nr:xanthine dehydrogenase family protein molybdopterin-binding subunit [Sphingomonas corticis]NJR78635.1 xanthine dehydrogenase family protein molybdopterin-binding subunit [Sphingomonas corticis]